MRCFIGIKPPDEYVSFYDKYFYSNKMFKLSKFFKLTRPENVHVTLKFLGEIDNKSREFNLFIKELSALKPERQILKTKKILELFPENTPPRVLYHGLYEAVPGALRDFVKLLGIASEKISSEKNDKNFVPHLTIGRIKKDIRVSRNEIVGFDMKAFECSFEMKGFSLFKSELKSTGAIYTELFTFPNCQQRL